jgi:hypothetical protein
MSWRFRKTFKVLPGVKLNLTARGLSATIGAAPFSVNVGPRGAYQNVSIPGTGIWDRQRIGGPASHSFVAQSPLPPSGRSSPAPSPPTYPAPFAPLNEIHSASTETLTSKALEQLRSLLADAYDEQHELQQELAVAEAEAKTATTRYQKWERGFLFKHLLKQSFASRKETSANAVGRLEELQEQLRLTTIATEIAVDREQAEPYYLMRDRFASLSESQRIWNVMSEKMIDRIAARSHASKEVARTLVPFSLSSCDLMQWEQMVPHLPNLTGGDMYIYPGFVLYRESKQAFALIDFRDVTLRFVTTHFTESDPVPSDSLIVGQTWAKCNKDGSPDRRFSNNYQIPLVLYGTLMFSTRDGLDVRYICSNARSGEEFVRAWTAFQDSFYAGGPQQPPSGPLDGYLSNLETALQASGRLQNAADNFQAENDSYTAKLAEIAKQNGDAFPGELTVSNEDFEGYLSSVAGLVAAARDFEATASLVSSAARARYRAAIEKLEAKSKAFSTTNDGKTNGDAFISLLNAASECLEVQGDFIKTFAAAAQRRSTQLGMPLP